MKLKSVPASRSFVLLAVLLAVSSCAVPSLGARKPKTTKPKRATAKTIARTTVASTTVTPTTPANTAPNASNTPANATDTTRKGSGSDSAPVSTSPQPTVPPSPALDKAMKESVAYVENVRGQKFLRPVPLVILEDKPFKIRLQELQDGDQNAAQKERELDASLHALRMLGPKAKGKTLMDALTGSGVLGFYDPKTSQMTIRGSGVTPLLRTILVHELTHALDDQLHDLDRPELDKSTDGSGEAFLYFVEGTARWVENSYRDSLSRKDKVDLDVEEAALSGSDPALFKVILDPDYTQAALFAINDLLSPYELGKELSRGVVARDGAGAIDAAYKSLPVTVEQATLVDKYVAREPAIPVPLPTFDGKKLFTGVFGIGSLNSFVALDEAPGSSPSLGKAAKGWGGDQFVVYENAAGRRCFVGEFAMDTETDRLELLEALRSVAKKLGNTVTEQGKLIRLESCEK